MTVNFTHYIQWLSQKIAPPASPYEKQVIYHNAKLTNISELVMFILFAIILKDKVSHMLLYGWFIIAVAVRLPFYIFSFSSLFRYKEKEHKFYSFYLFGTMVSGFTWAALYFWIFPALDLYYQEFLTLIGAGILIVAVYAFMPNIRAYIYFILPPMVALSMVYLQADNILYQLIGGLIIGLFFIVLFTMKNIAKVYKKMNDAVIEAQRANQAKSEFLVNMSHEMRIPMNAIISVGNLLQSDNLSVKKQTDYLSKLQYSSNTLLTTLNSILDLAKIESNNMQLEQRDFQLAELVESISTIFSSQIEKKQLDFSVKTDDCIQYYLKGDALKLGVILQNLISNAIKFTDKGGIDFEVKAVHWSKNNVLIKFVIRDTGIGISQEGQKTLFMPFYQVNISDARKYGGTGIGLSISQQLLRLMGSRIQVKSSPNKGSEFSFKINFELSKNKPLSLLKRNPSQEKKNILQIVPELQTKTILIIDDDELNQFFIKEILDCFGVARILVAARAKDGIECLQQNKVDLLLLDIQMPEMDGYQAASIIRENAQWNDLPIICLTAHAHAEEQQKVLNAGANQVLSKPIEPELLRDTLLKWL